MSASNNVINAAAKSSCGIKTWRIVEDSPADVCLPCAYPVVLTNLSSLRNELTRRLPGRFIALFENLKDLQQTCFTVRMSVTSGLGAEPDAHYTQGHSKLARRKRIRPAHIGINT